MQAAWSVAQRRLHWAMAALVFVNFLLALVMVALPLSALLAKILTYQLHKSLGLLLIPLWVWRLWGSFHWRCSVFWPRRPSSKCPCVVRREPSQPAERPGAERARRGKVRDGVVPGFEVF